MKPPKLNRPASRIRPGASAARLISLGRARGSRRVGPRLGDEQPHERGAGDADGGREEDRVIAVAAEQELAEERADRQAGVRRQREEADRLAPASRRRHVGHRGRGRDEEHRLADARHQAQADERLDRADEGVGGGRGRGQRRPGDQQRPSPALVGQPPDDRLCQ